MKKRLFAIAISLSLLLGAAPTLTASAAGENPAPTVIPAIREWKGGNGTFRFTEGSRIVLADGAVLSDERQEILRGYFSNLLGLEIPVVSDEAKDGDLLLVTDKKTDFGIDGYTLEVRSDGITVTSDTEIGLFYGVITTLQSSEADGYVPCGFAKDYSTYRIRAGMLDVARAWVPMELLDEITRYCAWFKLNELHLHLNEHNAFRLESDVPGLTAEQHYTKDEYRAYQKRMLAYGLEVVSEIDTPAHSGCFANAVPSDYMMDSAHLNIENPDTIQFVKDLLDEYLTGDDPVIVSKRFHIGTDEYAEGHNEQMRAYTDALLRHVRSRGYIPRFWGSFGGDGFNGETPVYTDAEADFWAVALSDYRVLLNMGYDLVNMCGPVVYIVPGMHYGFVDYYDLPAMYKSWQVNYLGVNESCAIPEDHPQLLGGSFALWNDYWNDMSGFSTFDIVDRLRGAICLMSEKTWCGSQTAKMSADDFVRRYEALSLYAGDSDPGRHHVETIDGTVPETVRSFGWPYVASADVTVAEAGKETVLFDGIDGSFYLSANGQAGFRRGAYDFTFNCRIEPGEKTHIELIADQTQTMLIVDGTYYYEAKNNYKVEQTRSSTFVLPLERISDEVSNLHVESKTVDLTERIANRNLALRKPTAVSGLEVNDGRFTADLAVDGNEGTRLSFDRMKDEQWLLIDLEEVQEVCGVEIAFYEHISDYSISVSENGVDFTEVARVQRGDDQKMQTDSVSFAPVKARFIRYEQHKRFYIESWNAYYSGGIMEFRVFGFVKERYTALVEQGISLLKDHKDASALRKAVNALDGYLSQETLYTPHLQALTVALQSEIDALTQPEEAISEAESVAQTESEPEKQEKSPAGWLALAGCAIVGAAAAAVLFLRKKKKK